MQVQTPSLYVDIVFRTNFLSLSRMEMGKRSLSLSHPQCTFVCTIFQKKRIMRIWKHQIQAISTCPCLPMPNSAAVLYFSILLSIVHSIVCMKAYHTQYEGRNIGVIAILTNNGILSCYNEQLRLKWKVSIYEANLINMSNLLITTSALSFSHNSVYVAISYSLYHTSVVKTRRDFHCHSHLVKDRLTSEEISVLKSNSISLGQSVLLTVLTRRDVDLAQFQSHPQLYILEKYKVNTHTECKPSRSWTKSSLSTTCKC